jgi:hypothetical protein
MVEIEPGDPFPGNATLVVTVSGRAFQAPGERPLFASESLVPSGLSPERSRGGSGTKKLRNGIF